MVFEKKQLSKALAIALMVACAVAFMPLLNGQAFAAAKKPAKVKSLKAAQVADTMTAKATWKKGKNCKKYNVKVDGVLVAKKQKAKSFTTPNLTAGAHKISVAGVNGKKVGKYKTVTVNIKAVVASVNIEGTAVVGNTLTATALDQDGKAVTEGVTYQWYRVNNLTGVVAQISGATEATYQIAYADAGIEGGTYTIFVEATVGGQTVKSAPTDIVTSSREIQNAAIVLPNEHTAPQLGDKLTAKAFDTLGVEVPSDGIAEITWYVGDKKIKDNYQGADISGYNGEFLTLPPTDENKAFVGKAITVVVKGKNETYLGYVIGYIGEVTSPATAPVIESTIPSEVSIETSAAAPFVGETIEAVFGPEGTFDDAAKYQWYRLKTDGVWDGDFNQAILGEIGEIDGATSATYTVTKSDLGCYLVVAATLSTTDNNGDEVTLYAYTANAKGYPTTVKEALSSATIAVASSSDGLTDNTGKRAAVYTTSDYARATVTAKDSTETELKPWEFVYAWYLDSVDPENQLFRTAYVDEDTPQKALKGHVLPLSDGFVSAHVYPYRGKDNIKSLVGHKLIVVASTKSRASAQGSVTADPTAAVQILLKQDTATLTGDTATQYIAERTTLTVDANVQEEATVSYTWYKSKNKDEDNDYEVIEDATSAVYAIPEGDVGVKWYKVEIAGTGDYYGAKEVKLPIADGVVANEGQQVTVNPIINEAIAAKGIDRYYVPAGGTLTASVDVAAAVDHIKAYTWTYRASRSADPVVSHEDTFTVPEDATDEATVRLSIEAYPNGFDVQDYVLGPAFTAYVNPPIKSVTLTSNATVAPTTSDPGHDGVAEPNVGETLTAVTDPVFIPYANPDYNATYQWYADDEEIEGATDTSYQLMPADIGKKITVTVTGGRGYRGSVVTSEPSGEVAAVGELTVYANEVKQATKVDRQTGNVYVGDKLIAEVTAYRYDGTTKKYVKATVAGTDTGSTPGTEPTYIYLTDVATIDWTVDGTAVGTGATYKVVADNATKAWTCTVTGVYPCEDGALVYDNKVKIQEQQQN